MTHSSISIGATAALLALLGPGCSIDSPYGAPLGEEGDLCLNGRDDDFDGLVDCEEAACDGLCPETTRQACMDGRDNDGDGVRDGADARCWAHFGPTARSCAASSAVSVELEFDSPSDLDALSIVGGGRMVALDGAMGVPGTVLLVDAAGTGGPQTVALDREIRASWAGISISASLSIYDGSMSPDARVMLALVPAELAPRGQPVTTVPEDLPFAIVLDGRARTLTVFGGHERVTDALPPVSVDLVVEPVVSAGVVELGVTVGDRVLPTVPAPVGTSGNLRLVLVVDGFVFVDSLRIATEGGRSECAFDAPQIPGLTVPFGHLDPGPDEVERPGRPVVEIGAHVSVAANADESVFCAAVMGCEIQGGAIGRFVRLYRSDDGGTSWARAESLVDPFVLGPTLGVAGPAAIAFDPEGGGGFHVAVAFGGRASGDAVLAWGGPLDCTPCPACFADFPQGMAALPVEVGSDWSCEDATETLAGLSYLVRSDGTHEWYVSEPSPDAVRLLRLTRGAGFTVEDVVFEATRAEGLASPILVSAVGRDDLVMVAASPPDVVGPSLRLSLLDGSGEFVDLGPRPLLGPSGLASSFDRHEIVVGHLWASARTRFLLYGARGDYGDGEIVRPSAAGTALVYVLLPP